MTDTTPDIPSADGAQAAPMDVPQAAPSGHVAGFDTTGAGFPRASSIPETRAASEPQRTEEQNIAVILGVPVKMQVVLGSATMPVASLLKLGRGAIVELDHKVGEPVAITINDRIIARGEVVVVEEDRFGVTLTDIVAESFPHAATGV